MPDPGVGVLPSVVHQSVVLVSRFMPVLAIVTICDPEKLPLPGEMVGVAEG